MQRPDGEKVSCRKCGQPIEGDGFGSPETGWEHPFSCGETERPNVEDLLMEAWGVIANVSQGDWTQQSNEWVVAAVRWRDRWHDHIGRTEPPQ